MIRVFHPSAAPHVLQASLAGDEPPSLINDDLGFFTRLTLASGGIVSIPRARHLQILAGKYRGPIVR